MIAACGPFERNPHIALALSGGADSLALMFLLARWADQVNGRISALIVDHGLRPESATEAQQVAAWAAEAGVLPHILRWSGDKPSSGLLAAARMARYDLMTQWCRIAGVLHLVTAHQLDDQQETVAMRKARGQSHAGLAGMSLISIRAGVRLLRPLLPVSGVALRKFLSGQGKSWVEDPSNQMLRFERIRWRQGFEGDLPSPIDILCWGEQRAENEKSIADLFARSVTLHTAGYVSVDFESWRAASEQTRITALGQLIQFVAGTDYQPARSALAKALNAMMLSDRVISLGGTLIGRWQGRAIICREAAGVTQRLITNGMWDNRFFVRIIPGLTVGVLGKRGIAEIGRNGGIKLRNRNISPMARTSLPAVRDAFGHLVFVPFLDFDPHGLKNDVHFRFLPHNSATSSGFTVASGGQHTI